MAWVRFCLAVSVCTSRILCNLRKGFWVYICGEGTSGSGAGARRDGAARRYGARARRRREIEKVMVYRPFSYLSSTFQLANH
jgi:hypothetical protein